MNPRPEMTINEEYIAFDMSIGRAVTQWAHVEHGLYLIALRCFGSDDVGTLGAGFFSIENFRAKLAFVDRIFATASFAKTFGKDWSFVRDRVQSLSSRRNEIAHGRVICYQGRPGRNFAIVPTFPRKTPKKTKAGTPPPGSLCVKAIDLASRHCATASNKLMRLYFRIGGDEETFAELAQQEPQSQTLAQLRRQIDAMHQPPAKSSRG